MDPRPRDVVLMGIPVIKTFALLVYDVGLLRTRLHGMVLLEISES